MNVVFFFFNSRNKLNSAVIVPPLINFKCSPTLGTVFKLETLGFILLKTSKKYQ